MTDAPWDEGPVSALRARGTMTHDTVAACRAALLKACRTYYDSLFGPMLDVDDAAACMAEREAKLREALEHALSVLAECGQDYNHPSFTDRHGTGPRITAALEVARAALAAAQAEKGS